MTTAYPLPKYISIFNPFHRQYTSYQKKKPKRKKNRGYERVREVDVKFEQMKYDNNHFLEI